MPNAESSGDITMEWERSGNTLYYHIVVETIDIFTPDPTPGDNYIGLELSEIGWVWDVGYPPPR